MAKQINISVIIPAWLADAKRVSYFYEALRSVDHQDRLDYEIIVVLDGCTLPEFPRTQTPVRWLFHRDRRGPGAARNTAARRAQAPYLLPLDADDILPPDALSLLYEQAATDRFVYGDIQYLGERGGLQRFPPYREADFLRLNGAAPVTALHPRAAWRKVGGWDEQLSALEDVDYYLKLIAAGYNGLHLDQVTLNYRKTSDSRQATAESSKDGVKPIQTQLREKHKLLYTERRLNTMAEKPCSTCPGAGTPVVGVPMPDETLQNPVELRYEGMLGGSFNVRSARDPNVMYTVPGKGGTFFIDGRDAEQFRGKLDPATGVQLYRFMETLKQPEAAFNIPASARVNIAPLPELPQLETMNAKTAMEAVDQIQNAADLRVLLAEETATRGRSTVIDHIEKRLAQLETE